MGCAQTLNEIFKIRALFLDLSLSHFTTKYLEGAAPVYTDMRSMNTGLFSANIFAGMNVLYASACKGKTC